MIKINNYIIELIKKKYPAINLWLLSFITNINIKQTLTLKRSIFYDSFGKFPNDSSCHLWKLFWTIKSMFYN
jgi:hypothetical protein